MLLRRAPLLARRAPLLARRAPFRPLSTSPASSQWRVWAALEERDEQRKFQLARLLQELSTLAAEKGEALPAAAAPPQPSSSLASRISGGSEDANVLRLPDPLTSVSPGVAADSIAAVMGGATVEDASLLRLLTAGASLLATEPSVLDHRGCKRLVVVGDLHGSLPSLATVLRGLQSAKLLDLDQGAAMEEKPETSIVFNGDFVDRGAHGVEVLCVLLLLKLAHPNTITLLRGNHEDSALAAAYGFLEETRRKYPMNHEPLWECFSSVFASLPLCARSKHAAVLHGGIPSESVTLDAIGAITAGERKVLPTVLDAQPGDGDGYGEALGTEFLMQGLLWSDPMRDEGLMPNQSRGGAGSLFGVDVARRWLEREGLTHLIRSHQLVESGCEAIELDEDDGFARFRNQGANAAPAGPGRTVLTVFSSAGYPDGDGLNSGAFVTVDESDGKWEVTEFFHEDLPGLESSSGSSGSGETSGSDRAQRSLLELLVAHKHRLAEAFAAAEAAEATKKRSSGRVTLDQWVGVMEGELPDLPLDWRALQPSLVPTVKSAKQEKDGSVTMRDTQMIDAKRWLQSFSVELASARKADAAAEGEGGGGGGGRDARMAEHLYANHAELLAIFSFLDTNRNGKVDLEEWTAGVKLLNERLPPERRLPDALELFATIDLDGSGEIELDEFSEAFRIVTSGGALRGPVV